MTEQADELAQVGSDAAEYVAAMTGGELVVMLDIDARRASGRCLTPRLLRAASEEVGRRA